MHERDIENGLGRRSELTPAIASTDGRPRARCSIGDIPGVTRAAARIVLCHGPSSCGCLLLRQDAVVRDRDRFPGDCARRGFDSWAVGR